MDNYNSGSVLSWEDKKPFWESKVSASAIDLDASINDLLENFESISIQDCHDYTDLSGWKNQYGR